MPKVKDNKAGAGSAEKPKNVKKSKDVGEADSKAAKTKAKAKPAAPEKTKKAKKSDGPAAKVTVDGTPDITITRTAAEENSGKGARFQYVAMKGSKKVGTGTRRSALVSQLADSHPKALIRYDWNGEQGYARGKQLRNTPA